VRVLIPPGEETAIGVFLPRGSRRLVDSTNSKLAAIVKAVEKYPELTVTSASYDKSVIERLKYVNSLIRTLWIETENPQSIPHAINWHSDGQTGQALVTMKNRAHAPVRLRCFEDGHFGSRN
jgi:hypothetical protein